jgi:serine/threonine protein kinase
MTSPPSSTRPLIDPAVDQVGLFECAQRHFFDTLEILQLVAASPRRALFVARDRLLKRRVVLRVHLLPESTSRTWFERETELLAALDHPVLRPVYAAGYRVDWAFRIAKWIEGESLVDVVARGPRPIPSVLQLARDLASVLEYVHSQRIVVRKLAPTTLMVESTERTYVTDLRFANICIDVAGPDDDPLAEPFLAPDVRHGSAGEPTSDIYSAGALLYFAVTGRAPALDPANVEAPITLRPACPKALDRVIMRALHPDPMKRYLTAVEMAEDLYSDLGEMAVPTSLTPEQAAGGEDRLAWEKRLRRALGDDYELLSELGSGGFGRVYLVRDLALEREVALKVLHPYLTADPAVVERFRREARAAAQVNHPHIVNTYDIGQRAGLLWYTMEYVRGRSLGGLVRSEGPQRLDRVLRMLSEALDGLKHAHRLGLVHRDIKPENLLLHDATGSLLIADFGLVLAVAGPEGGGPVSQSGTPDFAAPEQLMGEQVDGRTDLYSLTLAAYYALTGQPPFGAGTVESVLARQTAGHLPDLSTVRPDVPESVSRVLERGAAQLLAERWATAEDYARAIENARTFLNPLVRRIYQLREFVARRDLDAAGPTQGTLFRLLRRFIGPS